MLAKEILKSFDKYTGKQKISEAMVILHTGLQPTPSILHITFTLAPTILGWYLCLIFRQHLLPWSQWNHVHCIHISCCVEAKTCLYKYWEWMVTNWRKLENNINFKWTSHQKKKQMVPVPANCFSTEVIPKECCCLLSTVLAALELLYMKSVIFFPCSFSICESLSFSSI